MLAHAVIRIIAIFCGHWLNLTKLNPGTAFFMACLKVELPKIDVLELRYSRLSNGVCCGYPPPVSEQEKNPQLFQQVTLLYGDSDWMDATAGAWLAHELGNTEVMLVENAGPAVAAFGDIQ